MGSLLGVGLLIAGVALVVAGAEVFFDGLLGTAAKLGVSAFLLTVLLSGFELENLAAGIAVNLKGLGDAAAGTFLGGTTFLALGVTGISALISPIRASMPVPVLLWSAAAPLPLLGLGLDGELSRVDGALLVAWSMVAITAIALAGRSYAAEELPERSKRPVLRLLAGLLVLSGAGLAVADGLRRVVVSFGVSPSLIGNTAVAAAVEFEEVGRVTVPARHQRGEVGMGNLFGTVAHFTALNAGVIALVRPMHLDASTLHLHLPVATGSALLLVALVAWRRTLGRAEAVGLLSLYAGYVAAAVAIST